MKSNAPAVYFPSFFLQYFFLQAGNALCVYVPDRARKMRRELAERGVCLIEWRERQRASRGVLERILNMARMRWMVASDAVWCGKEAGSRRRCNGLNAVCVEETRLLCDCHLSV